MIELQGDLQEPLVEALDGVEAIARGSAAELETPIAQCLLAAIVGWAKQSC